MNEPLQPKSNKETAIEMLQSDRGNLLIAEAFHHFIETKPDTSNRDDMQLMLENIWPDYLKMLKDNAEKWAALKAVN